MRATRHPWLSLLLIAMIGLGIAAWREQQQLRAFPQILSAYSAKEYCSCRYVSQQPAEYCRQYVHQYLPLNSLVDDPHSLRVTAQGLGRSAVAVWTGGREGCRLAPDG